MCIGGDDTVERRGYHSLDWRSDRRLGAIKIPQATGTWPAQLYGDTHTGNAGDVEFYLERCRDKRVLEIGVGVGRLAAELYPATDYVGVEIAPDIFAHAKARHPEIRIELADVRGLQPDRWGEAFDVVIAPYNLFYALGGEHAIDRAVRAMTAQLKIGGALVFDVYDPDAFHTQNSHGVEGPFYIKTIVSGGDLVEVYETSRWNTRERAVIADYLYVAEGGTLLGHYRVAHDYLLTAQWPDLLLQAGLRIQSQQKHFDDTMHGSRHLILTALRAE